MSWTAPPATNYNTGIQSNVPDYQKMLQNNLLSSGWSSRSATDRYGRSNYSRSKSPLSTSPRAGISNDLGSYSNSRSASYQTYRPGKYGLPSDNYEQSYLNRDFKEMSVEDTVHMIDNNGLERTVDYGGAKYEYKSMDSNPDTYNRSNKYGYSTTSGRMGEVELERPVISNDSAWTSPPKTNVLDMPSSLYNAPARSRSSVTDALEYSRDKLSRGNVQSNNVFEEKYYSDNDVVTRGNKSKTTNNMDINYKFKSPGDLRQWQREQKEHSKQANYSKTANGFNNLFKHISDDNPQKWASVSRAAEDIIKEKDMMIDKLKMTVMRMEEDTKQYEAKLKRAILSNGDDSDTYQQIQELEYKNAELKAEIADTRAKKNAELGELELKLGATEQEVMQLQSALRKRGPGSDEVESQFYQLEQEKEEWKRKFIEMHNNHQQMKEKLDELQNYLADFPTLEETMKNTEELQQLRGETKAKTQRIEELQQRLFQGKKVLTTREMQIQELEQKEKRLAEQVAIVTDEVERIKSEGEGAALQRCEEELSKIKEENERLAMDLEKAKKLLETSYRKARHLEVKHQNEIKQLKENLNHEEESVGIMRHESRVKDEQMNKYKKSMKELGNKNQDLMEQNLILREQVKQFEQQSSDDNLKLQRRFTQEMSLCYTELQSLVQICVQRAEGKDPNMSLLLGVRSNPTEFEGGASSEKEAQTIKQWLSKLQELRAEIEGLRGFICNKYAEDMGENINCATQ